MRYEQTKKLSNREFKRLVGVQRHTFNQMVKVIQDTASTKQTRGCPSKLDSENQVLICLQYWREYRTYFHIAQDWQVSESTVCRIVQRKRKCISQFWEVSFRRKKVFVEPLTQTKNGRDGCNRESN